MYKNSIFLKLFFLFFLVTISCKRETNQTVNQLEYKSINRVILDSAYQAKKEKDTILFKSLNSKGLALSVKMKDTFAIADANWNYGSFYLSKEKLDSSYMYYYEAFKGFNSIRNDLNAGKMLYNMSIIQKDLKDYTGAEITSFEAISKFDKEKHHYNLYLAYNNLGVIYHNLKEFDKSIESHNKALDYLEDLKNKRTFKEGSLNNLGLVYLKKGDHKEVDLQQKVGHFL